MMFMERCSYQYWTISPEYAANTICARLAENKSDNFIFEIRDILGELCLCLGCEKTLRAEIQFPINQF